MDKESSSMHAHTVQQQERIGRKQGPACQSWRMWPNPACVSDSYPQEQQGFLLWQKPTFQMRQHYITWTTVQRYQAPPTSLNAKIHIRIQIAWTASIACSKVTVPMPLLLPSLSSLISARFTVPAMLNTSFSFFQPTLKSSLTQNA